MLYLALKATHVLAAMLFLGTGLGSAWYKWRADRSGDLRAIVWAAREIVLADWCFTVPAGVLLPATGLAMARLAGYEILGGWVLWGLLGYAFSGLCWLPAALLQLRMRRAAEAALRDGTALPDQFRADARAWAALGVPSFGAALATVWVMIAKHAAL